MHVRREFSFDDCAAVEAGLKNFRRYNQAMYISPQPDYIDQQLVENYFRAQEGSQEEAMYEDALSACAICSCNDNPDIPRKYKTKAIKKTLSIPEWLNDLACKDNVNFSNVLQDALIDKLLNKN